MFGVVSMRFATNASSKSYYTGKPKVKGDILRDAMESVLSDKK